MTITEQDSACRLQSKTPHDYLIRLRVTCIATLSAYGSDRWLTHFSSPISGYQQGHGLSAASRKRHIQEQLCTRLTCMIGLLHTQHTSSTGPRHTCCRILFRMHPPCCGCACAFFAPLHPGLCRLSRLWRAVRTVVVWNVAIHSPTAPCLPSRARYPSSKDVLSLAPVHLWARCGGLTQAGCWGRPSPPCG